MPSPKCQRQGCGHAQTSHPTRKDFGSMQYRHDCQSCDCAEFRETPVPEGVCKRPATMGDIIGKACPDCGHTNVLHPNKVSNPALTECVACSMQAALDRLMKAGSN